MSLDTLLKAAEFVELSSGLTKEENFSNARAVGNHPNNGYTDRRRVVSESEASERRRRPGGAGTRETHNKLEKNRRAHLKECFDVLKKEVPNLEDKKTSNLNILRGALTYIQNMKNQEQEYIVEFDLLKMNNKSLEERLDALQSKRNLKTEKKSSNDDTQNSKVSLASSVQTLPVSTTAKPIGESKRQPISVATQTPSRSNLVDSIRGEEEKKHISTSSTDAGGEGNELDRKISTCEIDNEDENTDTDENLSFNEDDNDIEIDVVGQDDSPSGEALQTTVKETTATTSNNLNEKVDSGNNRKEAEISKGKSNNLKSRKRSKSEAASKEEESDYDDNTKEEPKAKIQACARVSV